MIFLTIGTQLPFDRLVEYIDSCAHLLDEEVYGQIGNGVYRPKNFSYTGSMLPAEYKTKFESARLIVSHAGIGTVLSAKKYRKPIVMFPRRAAMGEHRNDHQIATCNQLVGKTGIHIAYDENELMQFLRTKELAAADDNTQALLKLTSNLQKYFRQK
jgi:UDP-N-acetylglucosamine transferase subunit ALG13